jgi:hypothetical protein
MRTGEVSILGPITRQAKAALDYLWDGAEQADRNIERLTAQLEKIRIRSMRAYVQDQIADEQLIPRKNCQQNR